VPESLTDAEVTFLLDVMDLARTGDRSRLVDVLDAGVPVNLTNGSGDSLLMLAAYHDQLDVVRLLLERAPTPSGSTTTARRPWALPCSAGRGRSSMRCSLSEPTRTQVRAAPARSPVSSISRT